MMYSPAYISYVSLRYVSSCTLLTEIGSYFFGLSSEYVPGRQSTTVERSCHIVVRQSSPRTLALIAEYDVLLTGEENWKGKHGSSQYEARKTSFAHRRNSRRGSSTAQASFRLWSSGSEAHVHDEMCFESCRLTLYIDQNERSVTTMLTRYSWDNTHRIKKSPALTMMAPSTGGAGCKELVSLAYSDLPRALSSTRLELARLIWIFHFKTADIVLHQQSYAGEIGVGTDPGDFIVCERLTWYTGTRYSAYGMALRVQE